ncbi:murein hydrolase activator EnvC family protein [Planobispora takensis]|uniref:murein hydrolase activator EnvC family protein n=1 Tax=Planobispora takensis TaxID=1367882 RepID=UPI001EF196C9|nr:M23 family metallopeptidase [Planobispora takensis]
MSTAPLSPQRARPLSSPKQPSVLRTRPTASTERVVPARPSDPWGESFPRWEWPFAERPRVLKGFAPPPQPWLAGHRGVDLAASAGEEVHAAGAGTIGYAGPLAGRGVVTVLHPGGLRTTYLPVRASVRLGQEVASGDVIGTVEDVPGHCPVTCLHWGLLRARDYLDPLLLLGLGQVRLLPTWTALHETAPTAFHAALAAPP